MSERSKTGDRGRNAPGASGKRHGSDKLNSILLFAKNGVAVLPLVVRGKAPVIPGGVYSATSRRKALRKYFRAHADANYGLATGGSSGIFVVDVDGQEGKDSLRALESKHGVLPSTVTIKTGRGRHYYFRTKVAVGNSAGSVAKGIDIRGDGGYVVGPGSIHETGHVYR
ncbi:MAG TPA: bifunctional DNA primase/polymerase, partial [Tepidisphaeraceae bacterium]|nr:bifunctional DNA primase/polymerase [Tepidisphaeraceae bacterium]